MKSIFQFEKRCWVCHTTYNLHKHHIYGGTGNRQISEKNGFTVYLCGTHHNLSNEGVHFNKSLDLRLKRACQRVYEKNHTREEFIKLIGKSYILDDCEEELKE